METLEAIKSRRSIRKFKTDPVPDKYIEELLEAARLAPSGVNIQPWRFVVIKSDEAKAKLSQCTPLAFVPKAPVVIACCVDTQSMSTMGQRLQELSRARALSDAPAGNTDNFSERGNMDEATATAYLSLNAAIAIEHITLRATDLGLGSCWVLLFDKDKIKATLELEDRYNVIALIPIGYPDQEPALRQRLPLEEIILKEI